MRALAWAWPDWCYAAEIDLQPLVEAAQRPALSRIVTVRHLNFAVAAKVVSDGPRSSITAGWRTAILDRPGPA